MKELMEKCAAYIDTLEHDIFRVSVADKDGNIETIERQNVCRCQNTYSVAKAFTMTAIGLLYDKGLVKPEDHVCDILRDELPEGMGMDERWEKCTVEMALQHRIGLPGGFLDIDCAPMQTFTDDFLKYMLTYPLDYTPGEGRAYTDGAYYLLARIVEKITGEGMDDFLWRELFWKLDFIEMSWVHCPKGHTMGATGLYIWSGDMVKLGVVYLNNGLWKGQRILSEEWCKMSVDRQYSWSWDFSHRMYSKGGMYDQQLVVYPEKGLAAAIQSYEGDADSVMHWFKDN